MMVKSIIKNNFITIRYICCIAVIGGFLNCATVSALQALPQSPADTKKDPASIPVVPSSGITRYGKETIGSLMQMGRVSLNGTTIESDTLVKGTLTANEAQLKQVSVDGQLKATRSQMLSLMVKGNAELKKCTLHNISVLGRLELKTSIIKGDAAVTGLLYAEESTFEKDLVAISHKIILAQSKAHNIIIKPSNDGNRDNQQIIRLKGKTVIEGTITFEKLGGIVRADDDAIIKGEIKGGTLERRAPLTKKQTA